MKTFNTLLLILAATISGYAQVTFQHVVGTGANNKDLIQNLYSNANGESFASGTFEGSVQIGGVSLTSNGGKDVFFGKLNNMDQWLWVRSLGTSSDDALPVMTQANNGEIVLGGSFEGTINIDGNSYTSAGMYDGYIARFNTDGLWMTSWSIGGSGNDRVLALATNPTNNEILVAGEFSGLATFGPTTTGNISQLLATGGTDVFFIRYTQGRCAPIIESFKMGNAYNDKLGGVAYDQSGNVIVCGGIFRPIDGNYDAFISRFDFLGSPIFVKYFGGNGDDIATAVSVNTNNEIYAGGYFSNSMILDGNSLVSNGKDDAFLSRLNLKGEVIWVNTFGGTEDDVVRKINAENNGKIWILGESNSSNFNFDGINPNGNFATNGLQDIYFAAFNQMGNFISRVKIGGIGDEKAGSISISGNDIMIVGSFENTVNFDPTYRSNSITAVGGSDGFIARYTVQNANSTKDQSSTMGMKLYPVPASNELNVAWNGNEIAQYQIYDVTGREVYTGVLQGTMTNTIDVSSWNSGAYIVRLTANGKTETKNLIKS
jgi:hypothetical protein